ncbi:hypothetical protein [Litchfieldia alkalitelluris]|uniref:hypothetical protein n=1 Tax=Litchfieldia alkalitelluris TaxID=304268 RepID=UPI0009970374|nr:hypothetical protein [Litchfieldia alkalitelluris]
MQNPASGGITNGNNGGNFVLPFIDELDGDNRNAKLTEDRYEIYVNQEYVGNKTLLNENDTLGDVDDFLKVQGFTNFQSSLSGDHYVIEASDKSEDIKNAISVYLHNR